MRAYILFAVLLLVVLVNLYDFAYAGSGGRQLSINNVEQNEGDSGITNFTFTVTLDTSSETDAISVEYSTNDDSATTADNDYNSTSGTLNFVGFDGETQNITVQVNGDEDVEGNETFEVLLDDCSDCFIADDEGTGTILNDDDEEGEEDAILVREGNVIEPEGDSPDTQIFSFTLTLEGDAEGPFTVDYETEDDTATTGDDDYVGTSGTLNFDGNDGEQQTINVTVNGDEDVENDERFFVNVSDDIPVELEEGVFIGVIENDDDPFTALRITDVSKPEGDSGTTDFDFIVSLETNHQNPVTVNITTADGNAKVADNDYEANSDQFTLENDGDTETFTVTVNGDEEVEQDEGFLVQMSTSSPFPIDEFDPLADGTIENDDLVPQTATLIVIKHMINDNGGGWEASQFDMHITGANPSINNFEGDEEGVEVTIDANTAYSVDESGGPTRIEGYTKTLSPECNDSDGIPPGETATCTITNNDIAPTVTVIKLVINDDGGEATADEWTVSIKENGTGDTIASFSGSESGVTTVMEADIPFHVIETGGPAGYFQSDQSGVCDTGEGALEPGENVTCIITNDDIGEEDSATLIVFKDVINDDGGEADASDFTMIVDNPLFGSISFSGEAPFGEGAGGTPIDIAPGPTFVDELDPGPDYEVFGFFGDCEFFAESGGTYECYVVNDDVELATLTVTKEVINDDGGDAEPEDFPIIVDNPLFGSTSFTVDTIFTGVGEYTIDIAPGPTFVDELDPGPDYELTEIFGDCDFVAEPGGEYYCDFTNDDLPSDTPTLTVFKEVINDDGGDADASDFTIIVDNPLFGSTAFGGVPDFGEGQGGHTINIAPGPTFVDEVDPGPEYEAVDFFGDCDFVAEPGFDYFCTVVNDDIELTTLTVFKHVINNDGGDATSDEFTINVDNPLFGSISFDGEPIIGEGLGGTVLVIDPGPTFVDEEDPGPDYELVRFDGDCDFIAVEGEDYECTVVNDDVELATLTVFKDVINDDGGEADASDFTIIVDNPLFGSTAFGGVPDFGEGEGGVTIDIAPGPTFVDEVDPGPEYEIDGFFGDCDFVAESGEDYFCDVVNDDVGEPPSISIDDVSEIEEDFGVNGFVFTLTLDGDSEDSVSVVATTADDTAEVGDGDYAANSETIEFEGFDGEEQFFTVSVFGDEDVEPFEDFLVNLTSCTGCTISDSQGIGTIENDDSSVSIDDAEIAEGDDGTTDLVFTVTNSGFTDESFDVDFETVDGSATTADGDYEATSGTLEFDGDDGEQHTISVPINGDEIVELGEIFFVNLSFHVIADLPAQVNELVPSIRATTITDAQAEGTIVNDDSASFSIDDVEELEGDAGTTEFEFTVTLDSDIDVGYTVEATTADDTATTGDDDYEANSEVLSFVGFAGEEQTFTVEVNGDEGVEPDEEFEVNLSGLSPSFDTSERDVEIGDGEGIGTIENDDVVLTVPDVEGLSQAAAEAEIVAAGLTVGDVTEEFSDTVPAGVVIDQDPEAGTEVEEGSSVDIVVSLGPELVTVPDVEGLPQEDAEDEIEDAGLTVGDVTEEFSETIPAGAVIDQDPEGGAEVEEGSEVDILVSLGPAPPEAITVPDVEGLPQADAEDEIVAAGLTVGDVTEEFSDTVPAGAVIDQDPDGGAEVPPGSEVDIEVSLGPAPPETVTVPEVVGLSQAAAEAEIEEAGLTVGTVGTANSDTVPEGDVISQAPTGGTEVEEGSSVDIVVSLGPELVTVPDVVGLPQEDAESAIAGAGLSVGTVGTANSDTVPEGDVISQDPTGGAEVPPGSTVDIVVSLGPELVTVPDVVGVSQADAESAIAGAGLTVGGVTVEFSDTVPEGDVISQDPTGGTEVPPGSTVDIVVSLGSPPPETVTVPDVVGLSQADAESAIAGADLSVGTVGTSNSDTVPEGDVISQSIAAGTEVPVGTAVSIVISLGPETPTNTVSVPNLIGLPQTEAESIIEDVGLSVGEITLSNSDTVPQDYVMGQSPPPDSAALTANQNPALKAVPLGTPIDLLVSKGPGEAGTSEDGSGSDTGPTFETPELLKIPNRPPISLNGNDMGISPNNFAVEFNSIQGTALADLIPITSSIEVGQNTELKFTIYSEGGPNFIEHVGLYTNLVDGTTGTADDTAIIYDRSKGIEILDDNGLFSNVNVRFVQDGNFLDIYYEIMFGQELPVSDIYLKMWDVNNYSLYTPVYDFWEVKAPVEETQKEEVFEELDPPVFPPVTEPVIETFDNIEKPPKLSLPNEDSLLNQLANSPNPESYASSNGITYIDGKVRVLVVLDSHSQETIDKIMRLGTVETANENLLQVLIPIENLSQLYDIPLIRKVQPQALENLLPKEEQSTIGIQESIVSEGLEFVNANKAHERGIEGNGIKIAVLDSAFDITNPEIAGNVADSQSFRHGDDGLVPLIGVGQEYVHGTAVAEIILDIAPNAELYLYTFSTEVEFLDVMDYAMLQEVDLITMSTGWANYPADGTSPMVKKIEKAIESGIPFVVSAGNYAETHWEGEFVDSDSNGWHEFAGVDEGLSVNANTFRVENQIPFVLYLTWDSPTSTVYDFDLRLVDEDGNDVAYSSNLQKTKHDIYFEYIVYVPKKEGTYSLGISNSDPTSDAILEVFSTRDVLEYPVSEGSVSVPTDAKGIISVGALNHENAELEPFSSQGPTNHGKQVPTLMGPDAVTTLAYDLNPFYGTSAAAPHVAGIVALMLEDNNDLTPTEILETLADNADTSMITLIESNNMYGYGAANAGFLACEAGTALIDNACVTVECPTGEVVSDGVCLPGCPSGEVEADGVCMAECPANQAVSDGVCVFECPSGEVESDGVCVDESSLIKNTIDDQWDSRPTFGVNHKTYGVDQKTIRISYEPKATMVVEKGFTFNDNSFSIIDNFHTPFAKQKVEIGEVNSFTATVYAEKGLKVQEFLFGIPMKGEGHLAELGVEVWYDLLGEIKDVSVVQKSKVVDTESVTATHEKVKCKQSDYREKCDATTISMIFYEPLKDDVMAIKAIDNKNRYQITYLNDGFDISGDSLNPMVTKMIPSPTKGEGLIKVTQFKKYSDYWGTDDGRIFEMNDFGSFKQINPTFERFQDTGNAFSRLHSEFGKIINYEQNRATEVFNAASLVSELPESFAYSFPDTSERMTKEMIQEMLIQEHIAQKVIEEMNKQTRWN